MIGDCQNPCCPGGVFRYFMMLCRRSKNVVQQFFPKCTLNLYCDIPLLPNIHLIHSVVTYQIINMDKNINVIEKSLINLCIDLYMLHVINI